MEELVQWLPQFLMKFFTHFEQAFFVMFVLILAMIGVVFYFWVRIMRLLLRRLEKQD